jgi:preprotein translocase subunit SecG
MDQEKIKNHLKITGIIAAIVFIGSSYIFGTLDHGKANESDRAMAVIIFSVAAILLNMMYYESYTKNNKNKDESVQD